MQRSTLNAAVAAALLGALALVGCKKKTDDAAMDTPPASTEPAATPAPAPTPAATPEPAAMPSAAVTVSSIDLGTSAGGDMKVASPSTSFAKADKDIVAAVSTSAADASAPTMGKMSAKWTFQDGQVVNEESRDFNFTGTGVTDFKISKPDGWPVGKYTVEISVNGAVAQSKEFEIK